MRVIGTAGHVDHGKSTLVEALTGTHPDRLREERERDMSIVLGFAWLTLPGGEEIGIVDVPGHRDFIENMLAGVGGIDAALFVVAADEGVMPQTREHLAILDLLRIPAGVIALTKTDLVDDPEWLALVEADVREAVAGTVLESAPLVHVSARTREGIPVLLQALEATLAHCPPRLDLGRPRLPVDRVFTMPGFGTVVTGTLSDGVLRVGDEVVLLPAGLSGRIRGLQTHRRRVQEAAPGSRTAVNLVGVRREQVRRGDVLCLPETCRPTRRLDVHFRLLPQASHPLRHNVFVKLFIGAAEVMARVRVLGAEHLSPGQEGWLQLEPEVPIVALRGDRFILRLPSPSETIGGGVVLDPFPARRHKRFAETVLARLRALTAGSPQDVLEQHLLTRGMTPREALLRECGLDERTAHRALDDLLAEGRIRLLPERAGGDASPWVVPVTLWADAVRKVRTTLEAYHRRYPLRVGMPAEELRSKLRMPQAQRLVNAFLNEGWLVADGPLLHLREHAVRLNAEQQAQADALLKRFAATPFAPPSVKECLQVVGAELFGALLALGYLTQVSPEIVFRTEDYRYLRQDLLEYVHQHGAITVAQARDRWQTSRRYVLALLEHFDAIGLTRRDGNLRTLAS